ncbi:vitamin K-dependent gamma-carboxylase [Panulirus ornatus]|uniref:vitamin K-dependent gamma-carboxylase n=1 Tax=Panulirus ornatus TaxID=150431 RepID=UPI003A8B95BF
MASPERRAEAEGGMGRSLPHPEEDGPDEPQDHAPEAVGPEEVSVGPGEQSDGSKEVKEAVGPGEVSVEPEEVSVGPEVVSVGPGDQSDDPEDVRETVGPGEVSVGSRHAKSPVGPGEEFVGPGEKSVGPGEESVGPEDAKNPVKPDEELVGPEEDIVGPREGFDDHGGTTGRPGDQGGPTEDPADSEHHLGHGRSLVTQVLGFEPRDLLTLSDLTRLLHRPCDPASLAATRIMFGLLMMLDVPQERGMGVADVRWGDPDTCRFPLFPSLTPLLLPYMVLIYGLMFVCAALMALGWRWRASCSAFVFAYWYLFLLDKSLWNNHSYLYGLLASILLVSDPHRCWSMDSRRGREDVGDSHAPLWSYALLRSQVFVLYFLAGVKKVDHDWLNGYSMQHLAQHWVFSPFRQVLNNDNIDFFVIHLGGFTLDLTLGFFLFFDATRRPALVFGAAFHLMNSMIFSIGMFPWVCLATLPVFCSHSWPRPLLARLRALLLPGRSPAGGGGAAGGAAGGAVTARGATRDEYEKEKVIKTLKRNPDCCYPGEGGCVSTKQKVRSLLVMMYIVLQFVLPFTHSITKGYNTWTDGPYGYSWDMMVHSWDTLHIKITGIRGDTGEKLYLDPNVWLNSHRWTSHADMAVQYGRCLRERLAARGVDLSSLYFDVWKSLNHRFQQRVFDPTVDILQAPWSPWEQTPWVLPLASSLSPWRDRLPRLLQEAQLVSPAADAVFVADFPGLTLENFLSEDLSNITLEVLQGEVLVLLPTEHQTSPSGHSGASVRDAGGTGEGFCGAESLVDILDAFRDTQSLKEQLTKNYDARQSNRFPKAGGVRGSKRIGRRRILNGGRTRTGGRTSVTRPSQPTSKTTVKSVVLLTGERLSLPSNTFHSVITTSQEPSSYMYTFINTTLQRMYQDMYDLTEDNPEGGTKLQTQRGKVENMYEVMHDMASSRHGRTAHPQQTQELTNLDRIRRAGGTDSVAKGRENKHSKMVNHHFGMDAHGHLLPLQVGQDVLKFLTWKWTIFKRSGRLFVEACRSILSGTPMTFN